MKLLKCYLGLLATGLVLSSANTFGGVRVVNCDHGDSLQKALESAAALQIQ